MQDDAPDSTEPEGKFYRGRIRKLFRGSQSGVISSERGRDLLFSFAHVRMLGPVRYFEDLDEGMAVGFDVGRTSKGLRVNVIRVEEPTG